MKKTYKVAILIVLAILVAVASIYWTPNMILCVPALVFFSFSLFTSKEKPRCKSVDLHLISLSISAVVMVLQIFIMLGKNTFACNLSALIMSILNTVLLILLWVHNLSHNS